MAASVYRINKGINKPIEFRGLKAQYIVYLAVGLIGLLLLFALLYILGVNMFICLGLVVVLGVALFTGVHHLSARFGQHGLVKRMAGRGVPEWVTVRTRKVFLGLKGGAYGRGC